MKQDRIAVCIDLTAGDFRLKKTDVCDSIQKFNEYK